jgi:hypothetical protein
LKRFGKTPAARIGTVAFLAALKTLVREHPGVALELAGAGLKKAGTESLSEVKARIASGPPEQR